MSSISALYLVAVLYLCLHLAVYMAVLRKLPGFRRERTIFLYHAVSCCVFSPAVLVPALLASGDRLLEAGIGLVMLHGFYSISFLELWSLSQISYSIAMLAEVKRQGRMTPDALVRKLAPLGEAKKAGRLKSLDGMGLVRFDGERFRLTDRGGLVATVVRTLRWLANLKDTG